LRKSPLLYIHIPFCDSKCFYCSFNSYTNLHHTQDRYIDALFKQFDFEVKRFQAEKFKTIYIGGGTPSTLSIENLKKLFEKLTPYITSSTEITIEANPNSASEKWLQTAKDIGVNRISFGVQSFNEAKLKFLGRNHSKAMAIQSINFAEKIGFENINMDIIYNTSLDSKDLLLSDVEILESLPITHVSMYSLTLEENTPFENRDDVQVENLEDNRWLIDRVSKKFPQYEISNFGNRSEHNLGYWNGENYIGLGSGAVGFLNDRRFYPEKDVEKYISNPLHINEEILTFENRKLESIFLGFRSDVGVKKSIFNSLEIKNIENLLKENLIFFKNKRYFNRDFLLADEITLQVIKD